jgi:hypothetical protein
MILKDSVAMKKFVARMFHRLIFATAFDSLEQD